MKASGSRPPFDETTSPTELKKLLSQARQKGNIHAIATLALELRKRNETVNLTGQEKLAFGVLIKKARERKKEPDLGTDPRGFELARLLCMAKDLKVPFKQSNFDNEMIRGAFRRLQKSGQRRRQDADEMDPAKLRELAERLDIQLAV
jgi:hypothetical protein